MRESEKPIFFILSIRCFPSLRLPSRNCQSLTLHARLEWKGRLCDNEREPRQEEGRRSSTRDKQLLWDLNPRSKFEWINALQCNQDPLILIPSYKDCSILLLLDTKLDLIPIFCDFFLFFLINKNFMSIEPQKRFSDVHNGNFLSEMSRNPSKL